MPNKYPSTHDNRRKELARIHMAAGQLGMDTADKNEAGEYRAMLWAAARVRSAASLDWAGRKKVLDHLGELLKARGLNAASRNAGKPAVKPELQPQLGKIGALLADMKLPWRYLTASRDSSPSMLKRLAGVERLEWAGAEGLRAIIAALERRQAKLRATKNPLPPGEGAAGG